MRKTKLTCVECPFGCELLVTENNNEISVEGNACPRGSVYGKNEVICPKRVLTTTVKTDNGKLVSVKTDVPIKKEETFNLMKEISLITAKTPIKIGDVIKEDLIDGANLIATDNIE